MKSEKSSVFALELEKVGGMKDFHEGQYVFLKCMMISKYQWHPFTVASAPQQNSITFFIRNQGQGTWTGRLQEYLRAYNAKEDYYKLGHRTPDGIVPMVTGADGKPIIKLDGPYAAPCMHCSEYNVAVLVGAGVDVTPLRATLQSIIHYRFKF
eukprot:UN27412